LNFAVLTEQANKLIKIKDGNALISVKYCDT
jgi:hypothetical protein